MRLLVSGLLVCLLATGCQEDTPSNPMPQKPSQKLSVELHQFKIPEPVLSKTPEEPIPPPLSLEEVTLPSAKPLLREQVARRLRGIRGESVYQRDHLSTKSSLEKVIFKDEDYQAQGLVSDISSYPVDRTRMLTSETRLSAVLEDSINSQIPGRAIAVIDRDILSSNGRSILIPAYSKIICHYEPLNKQGQTRLALKCGRILRPDGVSILLTSAQAADQMGRSGVIGEIDYKLFERYGGAFILSGISALAQAGSGMTKSRAVDQGVTNLSQNLAQITAQFLEEAVDVKPVITIAAGTRIQIIPEMDILLKKPKLIKTIRRKIP